MSQKLPKDPKACLRNLDRDDFLRVWVDFKSDHITSWGDMIVWQLIAVYKSRSVQSPVTKVNF